MAIFQAYCIDTTHEDDTCVLTFPDPSVADEWWRAISDTPPIASLFTRVNPQFYTHFARSLKISNFFADPHTQNIASKFLGRLFIMKVNDKTIRGLGLPGPLVQSVDVADIRNENWFYIRSIASPHYYWYYDTTFGIGPSGKPITVSETPCTRFQLQADGLAKNTVLVQEQFTIRVHRKTSDTPLYVTLNNRYMACVVGSMPIRCTLNSLNTGFVLCLPEKTLEYMGPSPAGTGRVWELVE